MGAGPAHAVHFGAYELVKEYAGGNVEGASNQWIATCAYFVLLVCYLRLLTCTLPSPPHAPNPSKCECASYVSAALAGASATIASDALMNPFDGESPAALPHDPASDPLPARPPRQ